MLIDISKFKMFLYISLRNWLLPTLLMYWNGGISELGGGGEGDGLN